jgi:hypothetical protein
MAKNLTFVDTLAVCTRAVSKESQNSKQRAFKI